MVATQFLELMSELCVGWLLLEAAVLAKAKNTAADDPDYAFYTGKVAVAEYFSQFVLPTIPGRAMTLCNAPGSVLELADAAFG